MHTQRHNDTRLTVLQIPGHFCAKRCANAPLKRQPLSQMWPIAGEKKIKKTRSTQAATKSAKSGFIQTHQKESFLFRRWQETRHEVYSGRHQECQVRRQISQKERFLPSLARETRHEVYPDRHQECQVRRQTSRQERPLPSLPGKVRCHLLLLVRVRC